MRNDNFNQTSTTDANNVLADGLSPNNPLRVLIGKGIEDLEEFARFHEIKYTAEEFQEFHRVYDQCDECLHWYKQRDFSSFTLGMVLCHKCDY